MRARLTAVAIVLASAASTERAAAFDLDAPHINFFEVGDYYEMFDVPNVFPCPNGQECYAFSFFIKFQENAERFGCLRYEDVWIRGGDGRRIAFKVEEHGDPGRPGYTIEFLTIEEFSGLMTFHVRVTDACQKTQ